MLAIRPLSPTLAVNNRITFTATGGTAPYSFSVTQGTGSVDAQSGEYVAPTSPGQATVRVTDARGDTADAAVTINPPLTVAPAAVTVMVGNTLPFSAQGGAPPYSWSVPYGTGIIGTGSGIYTAAAAPGTERVRVTDSLANVAEAEVTVNAPLVIAPPFVQLPLSGTTQFTATGGVPPLSFSLVTDGGTLDAATGTFNAPAIPVIATVRVSDARANNADATVRVYGALAIDPPSVTMTAGSGNVFTFAGQQGLPPYTWSMVAGAGTIDAASGAFTVGKNIGNTTVQVSDANGASSTAQVTSLRLTTDGVINTMVVGGNAAYIGGSFATVHPNWAPKLMALDPTTGTQLLGFDMQSGFNGTVLAAVTDGNSVWVGGNFTTYRGQPAPQVAKLDAQTGVLDTTFTQAATGGGTISTLVLSGNSLYLGGTIGSWRGRAVGRLAKVDATTGSLDTTFTLTSGFNNSIQALLLSGNTLYVGGDFTTYRGTPAMRLAKLDATTGALDTTFTQSTGFDSNVNALAMANGALYVGGSFISYRGPNYIPRLAKLDPVTGALNTTFMAGKSGPDRPVFAVLASGSSLYIGGDFRNYDVTPVRYFTKVDANSAALDQGFLNYDGPILPVYTIAIAGSAVYIGGAFDTYRSMQAYHVARVDAATGALDTTFTQRTGANGAVFALALGGGRLYAGGDFLTYRGHSAWNIAKLDTDLASFDLTFTPPGGFTGIVKALVLSGNALFVGGLLQGYRGKLVENLARLDATTGALDTTFTQATGTDLDVEALAASSTAVWAGGLFSSYRGAPANNLVKLDPVSGALDLAFADGGSPSGPVTKLFLSGTQLFVGGFFGNYGGVTVSGLARVDATTGTLDAAYTSGSLGSVACFAEWGGSLYLGGYMTSWRGTPVSRLIKVDAVTGALDTAFSPQPNGTVRSIAVSDGGLFAAGDFSSVATDAGAFAVRQLLKLDATSGSVDTAFTQTVNADGGIKVVVVGGNSVLIGGQFKGYRGAPAHFGAPLDPISGALK